MTSEDNRGPLENLYGLKFPNCDRHGLYNLKQVSHGQSTGWIHTSIHDTPTLINLHIRSSQIQLDWASSLTNMVNMTKGKVYKGTKN